ncbi:hypothetical protein HPB48_013153 [Haemaphysalis longicornis]|uniref:Peptidase M1 membrane alanine aminopeptidase domain-containing protein n=1 Tax=Haemaphysalis longicornis TaxID=44386 RepID=A0A9J6GLN5_HAELO|nr:hypothetical protein HPB48_013153 [Haemaphysalis longicornis]
MTKHARNSDYMVEAAPKIIRYCQETFGIDYPFPKLDFVALPTLPAAAMEQWGLVTFQDTYLIYQPDETPFQMKVDALKVMTNKVLQQWMGNLVTIAWWDDVWLKEGISRYLMYTAASNADPRTEASTTILENDAHQAMELDAFNSSHPVSRPLNTSMQIRKHLDLLTVSKAIKHGPDDDFHFLWKRYEMSTSGQERAILLKALSCTANLKLLEKLLLVLVNKNGGGAESSQKAANLLNAISSTSLAGSSSIVRFMAGHHDAMFSRYGALHGVFDSVLQTVVDNIRHENELHKLHEIYERTRDVLPSEEEKVLRMIHRAKEHIRWTSKYYRSVDVYLEHRFGPNSRKERSH